MGFSQFGILFFAPPLVIFFRAYAGERIEPPGWAIATASLALCILLTWIGKRRGEDLQRGLPVVLAAPMALVVGHAVMLAVLAHGLLPWTGDELALAFYGGVALCALALYHTLRGKRGRTVAGHAAPVVMVVAEAEPAPRKGGGFAFLLGLGFILLILWFAVQGP